MLAFRIGIEKSQDERLRSEIFGEWFVELLGQLPEEGEENIQQFVICLRNGAGKWRQPEFSPKATNA